MCLRKKELPSTRPASASSPRCADTETPQGILAVAPIPSAGLDDLPVDARAGGDRGAGRGAGPRQLRHAGAHGGGAGRGGRWSRCRGRWTRGTPSPSARPWAPPFGLPMVAGGLGELAPWLSSRGFATLAAAAGGEPLPDPRPSRAALVLGNEGAGIGDETRARADRVVGIPIRGPGGVAERGRRRRHPAVRTAALRRLGQTDGVHGDGLRRPGGRVRGLVPQRLRVPLAGGPVRGLAAVALPERAARRIRWYDNVPVLGWLWLRGKCRACGARISIQYPLVELLTAALWVMAAWRFGLSWQTLATALFFTILLGIALSDARTYIIPDQFTAGRTGARAGALLCAGRHLAGAVGDRRGAGVRAAVAGGGGGGVGVQEARDGGRGHQDDGDGGRVPGPASACC